MNDLHYTTKLIYIAAPLFDEESLEVIKKIENLIDSRSGEDFFSPREFGVIKGEEMTPNRMKRIFDMNIRMLEECDKMIAVTDNYDPGTIFELGYAYAYENMPIITYSPQGYGANVMLKHAIQFHCKDMDELRNALNGIGDNLLEVVE